MVAVFVGVRRGTMSYRGACVCGCMLNMILSELRPTRLHRAAQAGDDSLFQMFTQNHIARGLCLFCMEILLGAGNIMVWGLLIFFKEIIAVWLKSAHQPFHNC